MNWLTASQWSPYAVGVGIGLLSGLALLLSDKTIGCSTAFARTAGMLERLIRGNKTLEKPYYSKFRPEVDWEWMLVLGVVLGAFASARLSGEFAVGWIPPKWEAAAGGGVALRWGAAFIGGLLMGFGARWANGCTSGHGISGTLQLAVSSWIAALCFFVGGIASAWVLFRVVLGGGV